MGKNGAIRDYECIALACQGGGSLGAYHVGAHKAMEECGYSPDAVAGISIGAFTAAIIAGNDVESSVHPRPAGAVEGSASRQERPATAANGRGKAVRVAPHVAFFGGIRTT